MSKRVWFDGEAGESYTDDQLIHEYVEWVEQRMKEDGLDWAQTHQQDYTFTTWVENWAYTGYITEVPLPKGFELKKISDNLDC